jgi:hypothetical protein
MVFFEKVTSILETKIALKNHQVEMLVLFCLSNSSHRSFTSLSLQGAYIFRRLHNEP